MDNTGIYALFWWRSGAVYIGQSTDLNKRKYTHLHNLKENIHSNFKVQNEYNLNGLPEFIVIERCESSWLNRLEDLWQKEFQSLGSLDIVKAGDCRASGLTNPRSKYSRGQLISVFRKARNPKLTSKEISEITNVSLATVDDIRSGRSHIWLRESFPYSWSTIEGTRAERLKIGYTKSAAKLGKTVVLISPANIEYIVTNLSAFAKEHKLDASDLSRVVSGRYKHTKGYYLKK